MKKLKLTQNKYALVDDKDFKYLSQFKWHIISKRYIARSYLGKEILLHRDLLNPSKEFEIDHIDGNPLNNQRNNLRLANHAENIRNRTRVNKNNSSGITGVCWFKRDKKWRARLMINGKEIHLGLFSKKEDAIKKREQAAKQYFGEFAYINQIGGNI